MNSSSRSYLIGLNKKEMKNNDFKMDFYSVFCSNKNKNTESKKYYSHHGYLDYPVFDIDCFYDIQDFVSAEYDYNEFIEQIVFDWFE